MLSGTGWLCLAAFVFAASLNLGIGTLRSPGPGFIPFCGSVSLVFLSFVLVVSGMLKKGQPPLASLWKDVPLGHVAAVAAALVAYSLLLTKLGYILSTFGLAVLLLGLGKMKFRVAVPVSLLAVFLNYCLFHYGLKVPLPQGLLAF